MSRMLRFFVLAGVAAVGLSCGGGGSSPNATSHPKGRTDGKPDAANAPSVTPSSETAGSSGSTEPQSDASQPGQMMMQPHQPNGMDGGPATLVPLPDAHMMTAQDSGRSASDVLLHMVSVPPDYALADET